MAGRDIQLPQPMPEGDDEAQVEKVGYGRPPVRTRFQPGRSGNPKGRPKGARNKPSIIGHKQLDRILTNAFNREISVMDGGRKRKVTMLEASVHSLTMKAAKGDFRSQQFMLAEQKQIEARRLAEWKEGLEVVRWYQDHAYAELAQCAKEGREPSGFFLHPDDIHVDPLAMEITIFGPRSEDEEEAYRAIDNMLMAEVEIREEIAALKARLKGQEGVGPEGHRLRKLLRSKEAELLRVERIATMIPASIRASRLRRFEAKIMRIEPVELLPQLDDPDR